MTRKRTQLRPTSIEPYPTGAAGSVLIAQGDTRVLCTASIAEEVPPWLAGTPEKPATRGWVTAEYAMLPGSTPQRKRRGPDSRGTEIQRLIARVLRAAVVALSQAIAAARDARLIAANPITGPVAAVSVGVIDRQICLDLDYALDSRAEVDLNVAMDHRGRFIEVQGTAEQQAFTRDELDAMLDLAAKGIRKLIRLQRDALRGV